MLDAELGTIFTASHDGHRARQDPTYDDSIDALHKMLGRYGSRPWSAYGLP